MEEEKSVLESLINNDEYEIQTNLTELQERIINKALNSNKPETSLSGSLHIDEALPMANDPILYKQDYIMPRRIYMKELLKDPMLEKSHTFSISKVKHNQNEHCIYRIIINHIKGEDTTDEFAMLPKRLQNEVVAGKYKMDKDILFYLGQTNVPRICLAPEHQKALLHYLHSNGLYGGHMGASSMIAEIKQTFYWKGYDQDIKDFCKQCNCQFAKGIPDRKMGFLQLFPATKINDMVCIDHIGPMPTTIDGKKYITTYYDRYSGYAKSVCVESIDAFTTAANFISNWVCYYGIPNTILTDLGADFRGEIMHHLCEILDTNHKFTTSHHAACDGAVERFNRTLKSILKTISIDKNLDFSKGDSWDLYVPYVNSIHNNRLSRRTNFKLCPNEIMMGRRFMTPLNFKIKTEGYFKDKSGRMYEGYIRNVIRANAEIADKELLNYNIKRKQIADKLRHKPTFKVGELVKYWIGEYPATGKDKLGIKWQGPYKILAIWNEGNNYTLQCCKYPEFYLTANVKRIHHFKAPKVNQFPKTMVQSERRQQPILSTINARIRFPTNTTISQHSMINMLDSEKVIVNAEPQRSDILTHSVSTHDSDEEVIPEMDMNQRKQKQDKIENIMNGPHSTKGGRKYYHRINFKRHKIKTL